MTEKTLPQEGPGVHGCEADGLPDRARFLTTFSGIPTPYVLALPRWPERRIRTYVALSHHCRGRHEHRITAAELAATSGQAPGTVNRALRELEADLVIASPDPDTATDGRRWRFAHVDYTPPPAYEVTPRRGPDRKRRPNTRKAGASGTCDPRIASDSEAHVIPGSRDSRSQDHKPLLPDRAKVTRSLHPISVARSSWDGRTLIDKLKAHATKFDLGEYELADVARWLAKAQGALEDDLGVCPLPHEWLAFAESTFGSRTVALGASCPLAVALGPRRVVPWFRRRYACKGPPNAKALRAPATVPERDRPTTAQMEAYTATLRGPYRR